MRVEDIMTRAVEVTRPNRKAQAAWERMRLKQIHHLVVLEGDRVVGIISDRDLGGTRGAARRRGKTVGDLMTPGVTTARPDTTVRQAANRLRGRTIGCLPVVKGKELVGIITVSDLLDLIGLGLERKMRKSARTRITTPHARRRR